MLKIEIFDSQVCITIFDNMLASQAWNERTSKKEDSSDHKFQLF